MASSKITSELVIKLTEDATKQAPGIAAALEKIDKEATSLRKALAGSGVSDRLQKGLEKLGAGGAHIEGVAQAWRDYAEAEGLAAAGGERTQRQAAAARAREDALLRAVRDVKREEAALARARHEQVARNEGEAIKAAVHKAAEEKRLAEQAARDVVRAAERAAAEKRQIDRDTAREARRSAEQALRDAKNDAASIARERRRISREEAREERDRLKQIAKDEREAARERERLAHEQARTDNTVAGVAAGYAAHRAFHAAVRVGERYREYDKERRYGKVVMGLSDAQQRPLVDQAIRGSSESRYNDIQWLAAQRSLAARGYNRDQVLGFTPVTSQIGQAFDLDKMEDSVKLLEGSMLGFHKDVSTQEAARRSAQRTADLEVKASKISGATAEDIEQFLKRAAPAASTAHLSEEQALAFMGAAKKVNIGGDESATAFIALTKTLQHPTQGALTAMRAAGIDYSKYQKVGAIDEDGFADDIAAKYGVKLKSGVRVGLHRLFTDPELMKDPAKFTPAVVSLLRRDLHGNDAKSLKSIAGEAGRYRDASITELDTQGLLTAITQGLAKNPALGIALFGAKQAGRIGSGLDKEVYAHQLDELTNHSEGFAQKVSDERMSGFDGAVSKLWNQVAILETSIGRAFDNDGNGGLLTGGTLAAGKFVQALAEANPHLQRLGAGAVATAGAFAALKSVDFLRGGFGLKGSAASLTGSATRLDVAAAGLDKAAAALGAAAAVKGAGGAAAAAEGAAAGAGLAGAGEAAAGAAGVAGAAAVGGGKVAALRAAVAGGGRTLVKALPELGIALAAKEAADGGVEMAMDALGVKRHSQELSDYEDKAGDPVFHPVMAVQAMWAHLHGRRTDEENAILAREKAAAAPPIAPPKVLKEAPEEAAADDDAPAAAPTRKPPVSGFLARHPDFKRLGDEGSPDTGPAIDGARAAGGPVSRGRTYLVGERGPELFTAGATGQITNNRLLLQAVLASRDFADHGQRTERNRLILSEVLKSRSNLDRLRHQDEGGMVSTSISTTDVQRLLAKASLATRAESGDPETSKAIRAMAFELSGAVDGVARAIDRMDAKRGTSAGDFQGDTPFYGGEGGGGHPHSFGGGGRRGFMEGGHGGDGPGRKGFAKRAAEGPSADIPNDGDSVKVATAMLKRREGFQGTAKWDRNHMRLGYGSDTITDAQGHVREVKAGDHVSREDAERDLARRIPEFQRKVAREVGVESWKKLSPVVQGALTSMAYNYGGFSKLTTMRAAIATGDNAKIAAAIRLREGDNGGINRARREEEARTIERAGARKPGTADAPDASGQSETGKAQDTGDHSATLARAQQSIGRFADATHQCVGLVTAATGNMTSVREWRKGQNAEAGGLKPGAQIATFLGGRPGAFKQSERYADGGTGTPGIHRDHAAVFESYASQNGVRGMKVLEQYNKAGGGQVHEKFYPFGQGDGERNASNYHEITVSGRTLDGHAPAVARAPEPRAPLEAKDDPLGLRRSRAAAAKPTGDLHAGISGLHGRTIKPEVDISGIHEAEAALDRLHGKMDRIHTASAKNRSRSHEALKIAGLGSKLRGNYTGPGSGIG